MTAPALAAQVQGQASVTADNLNTYQQTCDTFAQLRQFVGLPGIQVAVRGASAINDGHGGDFYWDAAATGPDDDLNVIVPTGAATGAWLRLNINGPLVSAAYDFAVYMEGLPTNGEIYPVFNIVRNLSLPAGLIGSICTIDPNFLPTATITIALNKNGSAIGTITISTAGVVTITFLSTVSFVAGDQFSILWPSPQDATAANIAITFAFTAT